MIIIMLEVNKRLEIAFYKVTFRSHLASRMHMYQNSAHSCTLWLEKAETIKPGQNHVETSGGRGFAPQYKIGSTCMAIWVWLGL